MKKIVLLLPILLLTFFVAFSQSFTLSDANGPLTHDTIIEILAPPSQDVVEVHVYMTNTSSQEINLLVKKQELEILEGSMNTFCFNQLCFPPHVMVAPYPLLVPPGVTTGDIDFYGDYYPFGISGHSLIRYTFFIEQNPNDSLSVVIKYITGNVGISEHFASKSKISKPYPNPASSSVSFDLDLPLQVGDAGIVIRNLLGAEVMRFPVNNRTGRITLPVEQLTEGLYFYTLTIQGDYPVQTGRIVIQK
ncbi:MAG: T9SS type A sorting domain-containing protein [Bacteroidales bacterium]|nr:T9SS type A sorting domain-containing protein [Bacteroidales bacterium]